MKMSGFNYYWLLFMALAGFACSDEDPPAPTITMDPQEAEITMTNSGMTSWIFTEVKGNDVSLSINDPNAQITLRSGKRYSFFNLGGPTHPLDFRDKDGKLLLTQDDEKGLFEDNEDVNFVVNLDDDLVAFTLTPELAAALATYNCSAHTVMEGVIVIIE